VVTWKLGCVSTSLVREENYSSEFSALEGASTAPQCFVRLQVLWSHKSENVFKQMEGISKKLGWALSSESVTVHLTTIYYYYYRYSALGPVWAENRAQSGDWYGSGTLHPRQVLGGSLPLLLPRLDVPTFATRCLHVRHDARDPSGGRWNCGRESFNNMS